MPNPVSHFEIYADDPETLAGFYEDLFGWRIDRVPEMDYWLLNTVATDSQGRPTESGGINGGLMKRQSAEMRHWFNYVSVAAIDEMVKRALGLGAKLLRPKASVPRTGWFAILADPQDNVFGIWQDDPKAE